LILIDARILFDTSLKSASKFLGFREWLASIQIRIFEPQFRSPCLGRPTAKEDRMKHRRGFETAKAAATAETARRRMRHRVQGSDRKNSRSSAWDFASDWQANTYAQNALNQAAFGHGWHRLRDCDPHLNRPTARQANRPRATSPTNPNSITAPILAGLMEFEDRAEPSEVTRPDQTLAALKEPYHPFGEANSIGHVHLRPSKQLACGLLLPRRDGRVIHRCWR